jgi:hypothetical protein
MSTQLVVFRLLLVDYFEKTRQIVLQHVPSTRLSANCHQPPDIDGASEQIPREARQK